MARYFITGVSGVGKSTITLSLQKEGYLAYDLDEIEGLCQWQNKETGQIGHYSPKGGREWLDKHDWLCDVEKLTALLDSSPNIIIAGITSNQKDFYHLFNCLILLQCSEKEFLERLITRKGNNFGKDMEARDHILGWYRNFEKEVLERGAVLVSTEGKLDEVVDRIKKIIDHKAPPDQI